MLKYAKGFYLFGTFKRLFLFLFGLVCPLEVVSFNLTLFRHGFRAG